MINGDMQLTGDPITNQKANTLTFTFRAALRNDDKPEISFLWQVVLDLPKTQDTGTSLSNKQQLQRAFAVLRVQVEGLVQSIQHHPQYQPNLVEQCVHAITQENIRKSSPR